MCLASVAGALGILGVTKLAGALVDASAKDRARGGERSAIVNLLGFGSGEGGITFLVVRNVR